MTTAAATMGKSRLLRASFTRAALPALARPAAAPRSASAAAPHGQSQAAAAFGNKRLRSDFQSIRVRPADLIPSRRKCRERSLARACVPLACRHFCRCSARGSTRPPQSPSISTSRRISRTPVSALTTSVVSAPPADSARPSVASWTRDAPSSRTGRLYIKRPCSAWRGGDDRQPSPEVAMAAAGPGPAPLRRFEMNLQALE